MAERMIDGIEKVASALLIIEVFKDWFPELGTDKDMTGADVISRLNEIKAESEELVSKFIGEMLV